LNRIVQHFSSCAFAKAHATNPAAASGRPAGGTAANPASSAANAATFNTTANLREPTNSAAATHF